jgi:hypothetical protein
MACRKHYWIGGVTDVTYISNEGLSWWVKRITNLRWKGWVRIVLTCTSFVDAGCFAIMRLLSSRFWAGPGWSKSVSPGTGSWWTGNKYCKHQLYNCKQRLDPKSNADCGLKLGRRPAYLVQSKVAPERLIARACRGSYAASARYI